MPVSALDLLICAGDVDPAHATPSPSTTAQIVPPMQNGKSVAGNGGSLAGASTISNVTKSFSPDALGP
jgi:hypothetical protein